ncbi:helix-turn-helix domain-containing protein [Paenibacillus sp. LMG 31461]|uniref:Helix-turn-helix domain-containing protein n=1 Tax=Paenibacillus plantarum TaxID=2654975 RepID=A0ABX1XAK1_9BACL|nr:AraC family transcriptional regulator [Paenibacillus plantarum]NOU65402.1 helix-turn-helix domain-containing protein [Paenibacillus plantarum]
MDIKDALQAGCLFHFDNFFAKDQEPYGCVKLFQIGEICCESGYVVRAHNQYCLEISCIVSGSGYFHIDDTRIQVDAGDIVFNNVGHIHAITADRSNMLRYLYMGFNFNDETDKAFTEIQAYLQSAPYHFSKDTHDLLIPFLRVIDEFYSQKPYSRTMIRNYLEEIIVSSYRSFTNKAENVTRYATEKSPQSVGHTVYSVIRYIENHIVGLESIKTLSQELNYNSTYLSHVFKQRTGMTLQRYINHKKIEKALEMLKYGNISISQVSDMLGYATIQSFSKAFSRIMGYPPSRYVAKQRERNE